MARRRWPPQDPATFGSGIVENAGGADRCRRSSLPRYGVASTRTQFREIAMKTRWTPRRDWLAAARNHGRSARTPESFASERLQARCGRTVRPSLPGRDLPSGIWRFDRNHAAVQGGVVPDLDARRLDAQRRQRDADLAAVIGSVVERLGEPDPERRVGLVAAVLVFDDDRRRSRSPAISCCQTGPWASIAARSAGMSLAPLSEGSGSPPRRTSR